MELLRQRNRYMKALCFLGGLSVLAFCYEVTAIMCDCEGNLSCCLPSFSTRTSETDRSKLLGFADKIYVVSLPRRLDRREQIERLSVALDFTFEYLDAVELDTFATESVLDHVMDQREITQRNNSTFAWPKDMDNAARARTPLGLDGADLWLSDGFVRQFPGDTTRERRRIRKPRLNPTTEKHASLTCSTENNAVIPWTPGLPDYKLLTPGKLSCWYSHLLAVRSAANPGHSADDSRTLADGLGRPNRGQTDSSPGSTITTLILEDDIDMEHDIHQTIKMLWPSLPVSWDIVFLGAFMQHRFIL